MNLDEELVQKTVSTCPDLKLGTLLKEFERTKGFFRCQCNDTWSKLEEELKASINAEYPDVVQWTPFIRVNQESQRNAIVPNTVKEKYIRCNIYCGQYLLAQKKQ